MFIQVGHPISRHLPENLSLANILLLSMESREGDERPDALATVSVPSGGAW